MYKDVINDGLAELNKYYSWFDEKPSYVLALVLHLYYKLSYIAHAWGGGEEEEVEILAGNLNARNWQAEARKILKNMMAKYWETCTGPLNSNANGTGPPNNTSKTHPNRFQSTPLNTDCTQ
ncbi:hypothetical protein EDB86DRAFT_3090209 [Lactarius hatsudake]|nr:hypothetical protein EDB86DRAFT_3090209 [Lactarius hatsudake]